MAVSPKGRNTPKRVSWQAGHITLNNGAMQSLLETLSDAEADTPKSRELESAIHQSLLEDIENFWLTAWLKNRIHKLSP